LEDEVSLTTLDEATTDVVRAVVAAFENTPWSRICYAARWTPAGDVGADDYWLSDDIGTTTKVLPDLMPSVGVSNASKRHWRMTQDLGQARWYKMTVTVERSGKFSIDFEYKDDYQEGDIMRRG
jgi:hypothetical protein